jgi:hypothetical protein
METFFFVAVLFLLQHQSFIQRNSSSSNACLCRNKLSPDEKLVRFVILFFFGSDREIGNEIKMAHNIKAINKVQY